ncbi:MAG: hypothetical protein M3Q52_06185 [Pseudomonadota bacterium]|nr:hypothetical protein [Pseudomonadota bacterium]
MRAMIEEIRASICGSSGTRLRTCGQASGLCTSAGAIGCSGAAIGAAHPLRAAMAAMAAMVIIAERCISPLLVMLSLPYVDSCSAHCCERYQ